MDAIDDPTEAPIDALLDAIAEHLTATQERPVERDASRWIGEAAAVARDLAAADLERSVVRERLGHVASLLSEVEETGDEAAEGRIERAVELTRVALDRLAA